ncbi:MAG: methyltransferase domain-containing protein [Candidatus Kariarchaeaceae archaeon]
MKKNRSEKDRWNNYYDIVEGRPPRDTLLYAIAQFDKEGALSNKFAIDLGCGIGNDSLELMKRGWTVLAIDKQPIALERLSKRVSNHSKVQESKLQKQVSSFENLQIPSTRLLNSSYAIPFCHPNEFQKLWKTITTSIQSGGRFAGHLFGKNDQWADTQPMTFLDRNDIDQLFTDFNIEIMEEKDEPGNVANGDSKHWHLFSIVAKKKD